MSLQDTCAVPDLLPVDDAINLMLAQISATNKIENCALLSALDRILAVDIHAQTPVPAYDNSAMDGYALCVDEISENSFCFNLVGKNFAGQVYDKALKPGEALRIMTGAAIPANTTSVVMQEWVTREGDRIQLSKLPKANENIRRAGEDIPKDALVLKQGHKLCALDIALLASLGFATVQVFVKLTAAIFSTGDELTPPGQPLTPGHIYDSNRYGLISLLRRHPVEIIDLGLIPDDPTAIQNAFETAAKSADFVISSGGVSVGDADFTKPILESLGEIHFWKIAMKPGKPFAFGKLNNSWFFGLPGNPVSAVVTFHQLVLPALKRMAGEVDSMSPNSRQPLIQAITLDPLKKQPGRQDFQRGIYEVTPQGAVVRSAGLQSSGVLSALSKANCYIVLATNQGHVAAGEQVNILPFNADLL